MFNICQYIVSLDNYQFYNIPDSPN